MLADKLHSVASAEADAKEKDEAFVWKRPSLAGPTRCLRQTAYRATKTPITDPVSGRLYHVLEASSLDEDVVKEWIRRSGLDVTYEQLEVHTAVGLGHIDGVIRFSDGTNRLLDVKAINHFTFQRFENGAETPDDYITQLTLYLDSPEMREGNVTEAVLLIVNKNTRAFLEYVIRYDKELDETILVEKTNSIGNLERTIAAPDEIRVLQTDVVRGATNRFDYVERCVNEGSLPERKYVMGDWHCDYCTWKTKCWEDFTEAREYVKSITKTLTDPKDVALLEEYAALGRINRNAEKTLEELRPEIIKKIIAAEAETVIAGNFKARISQTKKSLILKVEKIGEYRSVT